MTELTSNIEDVLEKKEEKVEIGVMEAMKSKIFWYMFIQYYLQQIMAYCIMNNFKVIGF